MQNAIIIVTDDQTVRRLSFKAQSQAAGIMQSEPCRPICFQERYCEIVSNVMPIDTVSRWQAAR